MSINQRYRYSSANRPNISITQSENMTHSFYNLNIGWTVLLPCKLTSIFYLTEKNNVFLNQMGFPGFHWLFTLSQRGTWPADVQLAHPVFLWSHLMPWRGIRYSLWDLTSPCMSPGCKNRHSPGTNTFHFVCQKSLNHLAWVQLCSPSIGTVDQGRNVSTTTGWFAMKFVRYNYVPLRMNHNNLGDF